MTSPKRTYSIIGFALQVQADFLKDNIGKKLVRKYTNLEKQLVSIYSTGQW